MRASINMSINSSAVIIVYVNKDPPPPPFPVSYDLLARSVVLLLHVNRWHRQISRTYPPATRVLLVDVEAACIKSG